MKPGKVSKIKHAMSMAMAGACLLSGCLKPSETEPTTGSRPLEREVTTAEALGVLENMGFARSRIEERGDGFIVDGDMYFPREALAETKALGKAAQRQSQAVSSPKSANLQLLIHSSMSDYASVIHQAVNTLNNLKTRLHIEIVTSGQHITVYSDASTSCPVGLRNQPANVHAIAYVGSGGNPGTAICVNRDNADMMASERNRISVMTHEIGHNLGLHHTNSSDGTQIAGTATTDANSIMNSNGTVAQGILTVNDILAYELMYPSDKPIGGSSFDGDGRADLVVFRPSDGMWHILTGISGFSSHVSREWGTRGDMPLANTDLDGDGSDDQIVWRPGDAVWHILTSSSNYTASVSRQWGGIGDVPLGNMDIDGDNTDDLVVWRWTDRRFYARTSGSGFTDFLSWQWGVAGDVPVAAVDFDRDNRDDLVVWRAAEGKFHALLSASGFTTSRTVAFGANGDIPMGGSDYDNDSRREYGVWRPHNARWYIRTSGSNFTQSIERQWGSRGDVPVIGTDIDLDGKGDIVVYRRGMWHILKSGTNWTAGTSIEWGI